MRKNKAIAVAMALVLTLSMALTGCGSKNPEKQEGGAAAPADDGVVFALNAEPTTLDPQKAGERITWVPVAQLYDRLVREDENGELQPSLAESWEVSEDGTSITFKIREGVKFHDGSTMTVEDVAYSINRTITDYPSKLFSNAMVNMDVVDDTHVKLNLKYSFAPALYCINHVSFAIVPKAVVEADVEGFGRKPVGTGPFKFVEWTSGDHVSMARNEEYWRGPAAISNITFKTITDTSSSVLALEKGEIDVVQSIPESFRKHLQEVENVGYYSVEGASIYILTFNNEKGVFTDKNLRLAVAHAINREEIIMGALEGNGREIYAPMASFAFGYPDDSFKPLAYDLDKSKEYLAKAGKPNGFKVVLKCTEAANYTKPAEIVQAQLAKVGIQVEIQQMERGTYLQEVYKNCDYEMSIWSMTSDYPDGDSPTYTRLHGKMKGNTNNYVLVDIPELNDALDTGRTSTDPKVRLASYLKVSEIVRDEAPMIPLYASMNSIAANKKLTGVRAHYGQVVDMYDYAWAK
ncbi:MAG: ABC transporter substrate-binding protein [Oscillospiraceae bacterium]